MLYVKRFWRVWIKSKIYFLSFVCLFVLYFRSCISHIFSVFFLGLFSKNTVMLCFEKHPSRSFSILSMLPSKTRIFFFLWNKIAKWEILYFLRSFFNKTKWSFLERKSQILFQPWEIIQNTVNPPKTDAPQFCWASFEWDQQQ